jgi:hypothetical protein
MDEAGFFLEELIDTLELAKELYDEPLEDPTRLRALIVSLETARLYNTRKIQTTAMRAAKKASTDELLHHQGRYWAYHNRIINFFPQEAIGLLSTESCTFQLGPGEKKRLESGFSFKIDRVEPNSDEIEIKQSFFDPARPRKKWWKKPPYPHPPGLKLRWDIQNNSSSEAFVTISKGLGGEKRWRFLEAVYWVFATKSVLLKAAGFDEWFERAGKQISEHIVDMFYILELANRLGEKQVAESIISYLESMEYGEWHPIPGKRGPIPPHKLIEILNKGVKKYGGPMFIYGDEITIKEKQILPLEHSIYKLGRIPAFSAPYRKNKSLPTPGETIYETLGGLSCKVLHEYLKKDPDSLIKKSVESPDKFLFFDIVCLVENRFLDLLRIFKSAKRKAISRHWEEPVPEYETVYGKKSHHIEVPHLSLDNQIDLPDGESRSAWESDPTRYDIIASPPLIFNPIKIKNDKHSLETEYMRSSSILSTPPFHNSLPDVEEGLQFGVSVDRVLGGKFQKKFETILGGLVYARIAQLYLGTNFTKKEIASKCKCSESTVKRAIRSVRENAQPLLEILQK